MHWTLTDGPGTTGNNFLRQKLPGAFFKHTDVFALNTMDKPRVEIAGSSGVTSQNIFGVSKYLTSGEQ